MASNVSVEMDSAGNMKLLSPTIFDFAGLGLFGIAEATDGV
jgi:hypothetical protein